MDRMSPPAGVSTGIKDLLAGRITGADGAARCLPGADRHYVYVLCRANGTPFYVGKGVGRRVFSHESEARTTRRLTHKLVVIRLGKGSETAAFGLSHQAVRRKECRRPIVGFCIADLRVNGQGHLVIDMVEAVSLRRDEPADFARREREILA